MALHNNWGERNLKLRKQEAMKLIPTDKRLNRAMSINDDGKERRLEKRRYAGLMF